MRRIGISAIVVGLVFAVAARDSAASICVEEVCVRFEPPDITVPLGDTFTIDLVADLNVQVLAWGLDLTVLAPGVVVQSAAPSIGPDWFAASAPDGDGLAGLAFPDAVIGPGIILATLTLTAAAIGETDLLAGTTPEDFSEGFGLDPAGFAVVSFASGHATVVPEPASVLFAAAIGLVAGRLTRRRFARYYPGHYWLNIFHSMRLRRRWIHA